MAGAGTRAAAAPTGRAGLGFQVPARGLYKSRRGPQPQRAPYLPRGTKLELSAQPLCPAAAAALPPGARIGRGAAGREGARGGERAADGAGRL